MAKSLQAQLETAQVKRDIARAELERLHITQTYRAIEESHNRHKRKSPTIEFRGEDDDIGGLGRLKSVAKARDNRRNYAGAKAAELQLALNVIGTGPKCIVHGDDETRAAEWSEWFNGTFSKRCDGRGTRHLADQAKNVFSSVIREGDMLAFFDADGVIPDANGTLWYWEADQLPEIAQGDWRNGARAKVAELLGIPAKGVEQRHGLILDAWDRVQAYVVSRKAAERGKTVAKFNEVTILPAKNCTLLYNPWRINQKRGVSDAIETANLWQDLERFTESILQRALVQSFIAIKIKKKDAAVQGRDAATSSENPDGVPSETSDEVTAGTRYKNFEKLSMNALEYLEPDEDAEAMQLAGDLPDAQGLITYMQGAAGWSQGLSRMYATGKADASYSASMAESNMTWAVFFWWQKWIERYFFDWVAEHAFRWAVKARKITPAPEAAWLDNYSWHGWPQRLAINPAQEANARKTDLEIGAIDYTEFHGPGWKKHLALLGEQIKWSRDHGLFVLPFPPGTTNGSTRNE
jgi:hypothetical protein